MVLSTGLLVVDMSVMYCFDICLESTRIRGPFLYKKNAFLRFVGWFCSKKEESNMITKGSLGCNKESGGGCSILPNNNIKHGGGGLSFIGGGGAVTGLRNEISFCFAPSKCENHSSGSSTTHSNNQV